MIESTISCNIKLKKQHPKVAKSLRTGYSKIKFSRIYVVGFDSNLSW